MLHSNVEDTYFQRKFTVRLDDKLLDLSRPVVMGILNVTPDSFYSGSRTSTEEEILQKTERMLNDGATIIDIGGYSSRPGADDIAIEEETRRITLAISTIKKSFPEAVISIDTFRSEVAETAINEGAQIINDISGFEIDPKIIDVAVRYKTPYILMHIRGNPQTMTKLTTYDNLLKDIFRYFKEKTDQLKTAGVHDIILDPGFGFSKTMEQSHALLQNLQLLNMFDLPVLAGLSRKSMIYKKLNVSPEDSLNGTIALNAIALSKGARILRVHDVKEAAELIRLLA